MRAAVIACALAACTEARTMPYFTVARATAPAGCVDVRAEIVRTGKEGIGAVVTLVGNDACEVSVDGVRVELDRSFTGEVPPTLTRLRITRGTTVRGYVPIPFDFNAAYNAGARAATLHVVVSAQDASFPLVLEGVP